MNIKEFTQNDWAHLHDCIFHVTGKKSSQEELEKFFNLLPEDLQLEAFEWGMSDTLWRDNLIEWMESRI